MRAVRRREHDRIGMSSFGLCAREAEHRILIAETADDLGTGPGRIVVGAVLESPGLSREVVHDRPVCRGRPQTVFGTRADGRAARLG
jgi:hypothetical protein